MKSITMAVVDDNYEVRAKADFTLRGVKDPLRKFLRQIRESLAIGETAHLEIEGPGKEVESFEISRLD